MIQDQLAEQAVLGAILHSPAVLGELSGLAAEDFARPAHEEIFHAVTSLDMASKPVDAITVADELTRRGTLSRCGGAPYLLSLMESTPTVASAPYYAELVANTAVLRRLSEAGQRITQIAEASVDDVEGAVDRARAAVDALTGPARGGDTFDLDTLLSEALGALKQPRAVSYPTGFEELDDLLAGGLHPGTLVIIAARPGVGKSLLGVQIAAHVASEGHGALVVSLEMPRSELMERFFAANASVAYGRLRARSLTTTEWGDLNNAANETRTWPLAVTDAPTIGLSGIKSRARDRAHTARGLAVLVVDYLQLIHPADKSVKRHEQVSEMSRGLKLIARELGVAVVAAAQLNRSPEARADRKPTMADLRESGGIEADADVVLLLHEDPDMPHEMQVIVDKNRGGPKGTVTLGWQPQFARARSLA